MSINFPYGLKRSAAMIILQHQNYFLLLRRNKEPHAGKFVPVGGKLEPHEDPYSAAHRELREETGLHADRLHYAGHLIESSPLSYNWQCNIYWAAIEHIPPPPCPEGTLEWIHFDQLPHLPTPPTDGYIYQLVREKRPFALNAIYNEQLELISMTEEISGEQLV